jgi:hypothetical protein
MPEEGMYGLLNIMICRIISAVPPLSFTHAEVRTMFLSIPQTVLSILVASVSFPTRRVRRTRTSKTVKRLGRLWHTPIAEQIGCADGLSRTRYRLGGGAFLIAYSTFGGVQKYRVQVPGTTPVYITPDDGEVFTQIGAIVARGRTKAA